jgi:hypothetical protein
VSIQRPYHRIVRQLLDGSYAHGGNGRYVRDPRYAQDPEHYGRAYLLLQKDLQELFDYVEPADENLACYSYRMHELLLRACVEVEANCRAILIENSYPVNPKDFTMTDYIKIEQSHLLSEYEVRVPAWSGAGGLRRPFSAWGAGSSLPWYRAYNDTKHDRHTAFKKATFEHMLDAVCGCLTLLSAQFIGEDFSSQPVRMTLEDPPDGMSEAIGGYFRVRFPRNWPASERYDFTWHVLKNDADPFQQYPYPTKRPHKGKGGPKSRRR